MINWRLVGPRSAILSAVFLTGLRVDHTHAAKFNFEFLPPATPTNKNTGPGDVPGWGALVVMFSGNVTNAQYAIADSPCPNFMAVPGFAGPANMLTLVPPGPAGSGYRIPAGKTVTIMVESDQNVTVKAGAGSPPTPTYWRYKGNDADTRNVAARVVPEPSSTLLVATAAPLVVAAGRRRADKLRTGPGEIPRRRA